MSGAGGGELSAESDAVRAEHMRAGPDGDFQLIDIDPLGFTHARSEMRDDTDDALDVPLCFVGEARRSGATAADLNVTFDVALDIEDFPRTDDLDRVSCPDCREWINA